MTNEERTVIVTDKEIERRIAAGEDRTDWARVDAMSEHDLEAVIATDPDEDLADHAGEWFDGVPPPPPRKKYIHIGLDEDVVAWFQSAGSGYQTRINAVLRTFYRAKRGREGAPR